MPVEVRDMAREDIPRVARLWEEYAPRTQFADLRVSIRALETNLAALLLNPNAIMLVGVRNAEVVGFLHGGIEYWILNDEPFVSNVAFYPGKEPTHAASLSMLREFQKRVEARGITQQVVSFYSGLEQEKTSALLEALGYTEAGKAMKKGF